MSQANLRHALIRKYKDWRGEKRDLSKERDRIKAAYQALPDMEQRTVQLEKLIDSVETIMSEIAPTWNPAKERPTAKHEMKLPFEVGAVTRWALDILREAEEPLRSRAIGIKILEMNGYDIDEHKDLLDRVVGNVDATLRTKLAKGLVKAHDKWPKRWSVVDFGDRPVPDDAENTAEQA